MDYIPALNALVEMLTERGFTSPGAELTMRDSNQNCYVYISTYEARHFCYGETPEKALEEGKAKILSMATPRETRVEQFQQKLANLVDEGAEIGFDVDENPHEEAIMAALRKQLADLSENIITHQPLAAE